MNLIDQSVAWIIPAALIALFMVFSMVRFTAALLARPGRARESCVDTAELRARLAALGEADKPYRVVEARHGCLELAWDVVDAAWSEPFSRVKLSTEYRARMSLDEPRREVRWFESLRSTNVFLGFDGWRARWNASLFYQSGYLNVVWSGVAFGIRPGFPPRIGRVREFHLDTIAVKDDIRAVVERAGWGFRPVTLGVEVDPPRWVRGVGRALSASVPAAMRSWSERQVWGVLYPLSFALFLVYVLAVLLSPDEITLADGGIVFAVAGAWWGLWALLAWTLLGFPGGEEPRRGGRGGRGARGLGRREGT